MAKILVVEDDESQRSSLKLLLERAGYQVFEAANGNEAAACCHEQEPDLVLTDIFMPQHEGLELIRKLRKQGSQSKIIAMSGGARFTSGSFLNVALDLGADAVLAKPFSREKMIDTVAQVLGTPVNTAANSALERLDVGERRE